jgi:hypothetical protein
MTPGRFGDRLGRSREPADVAPWPSALSSVQQEIEMNRNGGVGVIGVIVIVVVILFLVGVIKI